MNALDLTGLCFRYSPEVPTLHDVSLEVRRGEILTLVGPNGSGKTTLLRLMDRILLPGKGSIRLEGRDMADFSRAELAKRIAFVPQEPTPLFPFTVAEIILMGRSPHLHGSVFEGAHDREIARKMMELTDTVHLAEKPVTALSGGERQRVFIARALAQQPDIMLLDEPNAHLDIAHQIDIFRILTKLHASAGLTVVAVSHDLNLAASYSSRIALLVCGSLVAVGPPKAVLTRKKVREAFQTDVVIDRHPRRNVPRITLLP
ncbi:MAG TPA: ABC transporter ATP-binding protein [Bacteroidota bacterium]|nr:ABC transporter ATP-binding protein [Bacteroidota bacterium]